MNTNTTAVIEAGQTLTTRSACNYDCIFKCEVLTRKWQFVTVRVEGREKRCKVHVYDGAEFIKPMGNYSMAPIFRAGN